MTNPVFSCVIIEDEPLARNLLQDYILKDPNLQLMESFANPVKGLQFLQNNEIDLLFLDIQMPEITGLSLLKMLNHKPVTIFTTAYSEYALDGFELDVADYLLKPITLDRFLQAVDKAKKRINAYPTSGVDPLKTTLFVKDGTKLVKLQLNDIFYIEGLKDYVSIYTKGPKIVSLQRMKNLENELPKESFLRVHHSYIVSLDKIQAIHKDSIDINGQSIPIGETYRKSFREFVDKQKLLGEK